MNYSRGTVRRVYKQIAGGVLAQALTGTWTNGGSVSIEAATDFSPDGGDGFFEDEAFSYASRVINPSDAANAKDTLTGVVRDNPVAHAIGTSIQEGATETVEKMVDIEVEGELFTGIPVDPKVYTYLKLGTYADDDMPVVAVEWDDDGIGRVVEAPQGVAPLVGADTETLPGTGDGDGTVDPDTGNPPPGQGWEDGEPPSTAPVLTAVGGVGFISLRASAIENGSAVTYKFYGHTTNGFTPAENNFIGSVRLSGEAGFLPSLTVKDFPTGHVLDGGANDPVKNPTVYYFVAVPYDGSGAGPASNQASATPVLIQTVDANPGFVTAALIANGAVETAKIALDAITNDLIAASAVTATEIADNAITTPKLLANAVTAAKIAAHTITANEIAAGTITATEILANTITAAKIATGTITSNEIAANTITAADIAAGTITTTEIAANTIVAGDIAAGTITGTQIAATTITADKLSVSTLSAITANLGTITAGSLSAVTITSGTLSSASISSSTVTSSSFATSSSSPRGASTVTKVENAEVNFTVTSGGTHTATIQAGAGTIPSAILYLTGRDIQIEGRLVVDVGSTSTNNQLEMRTTGASPSAPGTGRCVIFYDGSAGTNGVLKARNPTSTQTLATF